LSPALTEELGKGAAAFWPCLHLFRSWAPLQHPSQSRNKGWSGSASRQLGCAGHGDWDGGSCGHLGAALRTRLGGLQCRGISRRLWQLLATPGPRAPGKIISPSLKNAAALAASLPRHPSAAAWRRATPVPLPAHLAALPSVPGGFKHRRVLVGA